MQCENSAMQINGNPQSSRVTSRKISSQASTSASLINKLLGTSFARLLATKEISMR